MCVSDLGIVLYIIFVIFASVVWVTATTRIRLSCSFSHVSELWFMVSLRTVLGLGLGLGIGLWEG